MKLGPGRQSTRRPAARNSTAGHGAQGGFSVPHADDGRPGLGPAEKTGPRMSRHVPPSVILTWINGRAAAATIVTATVLTDGNHARRCHPGKAVGENLAAVGEY